MAFLDDVNNKLSRMGQNALQKTKDMSESVRISGAVHEEEEKQEKWYKEIGKIFYENYAAQADGELKVLCSNIRTSKAQVKQYKEQLIILKGTIQCPNCGAEITNNSSFCNVCGAKIEQPKPVAPAPISGELTCANCGAPMTAGQRFCMNCGAEMKEERIVSVSEEPVTQEKQNICPNCGKELTEGAMFCINCGTRIE